VPIDPTLAIGATLPDRDVVWSASDVLLYHLALGAGATPGEAELRYAYERDLQVLPTFAVVATMLGSTAEPVFTLPGINLDLATLLHGGQEVIVHRPLPVEGKAVSRARIADVYDKGTAAVIVHHTELVGVDGNLLATARSRVFARGAGGFGGERGPSGRVPLPDRAPDTELLTPTLPQQALWYRLCGDRNPLHADPAFAATAGFPRPILHGLCTYGMVCKAVVDAMLGGDVTRLARYSARFAGVVFPGETLRTRVWREGRRLVLDVGVVERAGAAALSDAVITEL
jgi:acyl dehydratase